MENETKVRQKARNLTTKPGVYLMKNKTGKIIYIGKAKSLKNRVNQYFQEGHNQTLKVEKMISNIYDFDFIVTDTELEALVLECNLIKLHKPKYNILLKDDKNYPYLKITVNEPYPKIMLARNMKKDGAKYYGPYFSSKTVYDTIWMLRRIFLISNCKLVFPRDIKKGRPCLNYHIKRCIGPCTGEVTSQQYQDLFQDIIAFLEGDYQNVIVDLQKKMLELSDNMEYEKARVYRDRIQSIQKLGEKQKVVLDTQKDCDIISFYIQGDILCFSVLLIRFGKLIDKRVIQYKNITSFDESDALTQFVKQFYNKKSNIPKEILLSASIEDKALLEEYFHQISNQKVKISTPQRGRAMKLIQLAINNAKEEVQNEIRSMEKGRGQLLELKRILNLDTLPSRIEAYDISNLGNNAMVGGMVVFEDAKPKKSDYRKFKIKYHDGQDDYSSMKEVIYRRLERAQEEELQQIDADKAKFSNLPDLILLDGGLGHVNAVSQMLSELDIHIPVFGMVKNRSHRTRDLVSAKGEVGLSSSSEIFVLIGKISEEVHRYAITYHKTVRKKQSFASQLDGIKGLGEAKKKALLSQFKKIEAIKNATVEELSKVKGINLELAQRIKEKLDGENQ